MHHTWIMILAIFAPVLCGLATLVLPKKILAPRVALAALGPIASLALLAQFVRDSGLRSTPAPIEWVPLVHLELSFLTGTLSLFFAFLITAIGLLITLYARAYFGPDPDSLRRFYPALLLFMTAMLGVVLSDCFMLLIIFWELTSVSSFLLIGWDREDPAAIKKATQALVVTGAGGLSLFAGLILIGIDTQAWSITQLANTEFLHEVAGHPFTYVGLLLVFLGAAAKSAQMPLHFWLPGAMAAPTPVSAYLHSATMVKAGVYLVAILTYAGGYRTQWPLVLVPVGAATMLYGAYLALQKTDLKQIFAYCTVSQLGLLMMSYGVPWLGQNSRVDFDVLQILSHALYKAPLFMLAGAIGHVVLTRELPRLQGLARGPHRLLAWLLIVAAYALASGPFTLGFAMKERLLEEIWAAYTHESKWFLAVAAAVVLTSALNVAIFIRLTRTLLGPRPVQMEQPVRDLHDADEADTHHDKSPWPALLWIPAAALLLLQMLGGVMPGTVVAMVSPILHDARALAVPSVLHALSHPGPALMLSLIGFAIGAAIAFAPVLRGPMTDPYDGLFPWFDRLLTRGGGRVFSLVQNGRLSFYIGAIFASAVALFVWAIRGDAAWMRWPSGMLDEPRSALLIAGALTSLACVPALLMPWANTRFLRVLMLGTTGFGVTCIYYAWHAPDLALTQITIEVVSLVLFLLVLARLPESKPQPARWTKLPRLLLSLAVGGVMFWLTLGSAVGPGHENLGDYFLRNSRVGVDSQAVTPGALQPGLVDRGTAHRDSFGTESIAHSEVADDHSVTLHKGGGGNNSVNVILVDFRGFDTMGEITVLGLAAMGVWMLLRKRSKKQEPPAAPMTSVILRSASRIIVPVSFALAWFIYFKGHQSPGGGFVAGLVASAGLVIHRMAEGPQAMALLRKLMPFSERMLIALGLLLALGTGTAALLAGLPFFTSNNGYFPLPGDSHGFHWATVMVFDLGVFCVVTGVVVGMINALFDDAAQKGGAA